VCANEYVRIAETIAAEPDRLADVVEEVISRTNATSTEQELLDDLVHPKSASTPSQ
jgi:hypothetical protein